MSHRLAAWLAWSLWTLSVALAALGLLLQYVNDPSRFLEQFSYAVPFLVFVTVGALVASYRPETLSAGSSALSASRMCSGHSRLRMPATRSSHGPARSRAER